ncbi:hypothetical protein BJ741DRAFT_575121 [Chytriomyces cf. hyalinus JEL632]|nr:hypothetical protein BJ741DRAFT_575121 [Chytriomyces cf. hyalinus JEL632]
MDHRIDRCTMPHEFISDNLILNVSHAVTNDESLRTFTNAQCASQPTRTCTRAYSPHWQQARRPKTSKEIKAAQYSPSKRQTRPCFGSSANTVACKNASKGCVWTGSLLDDETHAAECTAECQKPVCSKAVSELEACKIKCTNVESKFAACKNEFEALKIKFAGMERELAACKVRCAEAERRAADAGGTARSADESLAARHAEEVSRLNSQISQLNQNAQVWQLWANGA